MTKRKYLTLQVYHPVIFCGLLQKLFSLTKSNTLAKPALIALCTLSATNSLDCTTTNEVITIYIIVCVKKKRLGLTVMQTMICERCMMILVVLEISLYSYLIDTETKHSNCVIIATTRTVALTAN